VVAAFLPDADDWLVSGRFARRAALLWGFAPHEARALFLLCAGYTGCADQARIDGLSMHSIKNRRLAAYRRLGVAGPVAAPAAVRLAWPLYRACARPTRRDT
jgi:hypothetical protein